LKEATVLPVMKNKVLSLEGKVKKLKELNDKAK